MNDSYLRSIINTNTNSNIDTTKNTTSKNLSDTTIQIEIELTNIKPKHYVVNGPYDTIMTDIIMNNYYLKESPKITSTSLSDSSCNIHDINSYPNSDFLYANNDSHVNTMGTTTSSSSSTSSSTSSSSPSSSSEIRSKYLSDKITSSQPFHSTNSTTFQDSFDSIMTISSSSNTDAMDAIVTDVLMTDTSEINSSTDMTLYSIKENTLEEDPLYTSPRKLEILEEESESEADKEEMDELIHHEIWYTCCKRFMSEILDEDSHYFYIRKDISNQELIELFEETVMIQLNTVCDLYKTKDPLWIYLTHENVHLTFIALRSDKLIFLDYLIQHCFMDINHAYITRVHRISSEMDCKDVTKQLNLYSKDYLQIKTPLFLLFDPKHYYVFSSYAYTKYTESQIISIECSENKTENDVYFEELECMKCVRYLIDHGVTFISNYQYNPKEHTIQLCYDDQAIQDIFAFIPSRLTDVYDFLMHLIKQEYQSLKQSIANSNASLLQPLSLESNYYLNNKLRQYHKYICVMYTASSESNACYSLLLPVEKVETFEKGRLENLSMVQYPQLSPNKKWFLHFFNDKFTQSLNQEQLKCVKQTELYNIRI